MPIPREEPDVSQVTPPGAKPRLSVVVVLAMLLGIVLTILLMSAYFNFQRINALQDEVQVTRSALKDKSQAVEEMKTQIEALSKQMSLLKEYSVARSAADRGVKADSVPAVVHETSSPVSGDDHKDVSVVTALPKTRKAKPASPNCDLVGKSADEQTATLERCADASEPSAPPSRRR